MKHTLAVLAVAASATLAACGAVAPSYRDQSVTIASNANFDPARYAGRWYEVARYPNPFQSDCAGATQYHLYVIKSGASIPVVDKDDIPASSYHHVSSGAYIATPNLTGWTWKVRARVGGAWNDWSPTRSFSVEPPDTD